MIGDVFVQRSQSSNRGRIGDSRFLRNRSIWCADWKCHRNCEYGRELHWIARRQWNRKSQIDLATGSPNLTAAYRGDGNFKSSTSAKVTEAVN